MNDIYDFLNQLPKDMIVIECGGHLGTDTQKLCEMFPRGHIHCIEANIALYQFLKNKLMYNNLTIYNLALADKNEIMDFYIDNNSSGNHGASSLLQSTEGYLNSYIKDEVQVYVEGKTLDNFCVSNLIERVDLLWLDVEGFEYYILQSAGDFLRNIKYIYTEVNFQEFRKNGKLYEDIKSFLSDHHFEEVYKWAQGAEWGEWQGNVLFENKR